MKRTFASLAFLSVLSFLMLSGCGGNSTPAPDVPFPSGLNQITATDIPETTTFFTLNGNLAKNGNSVSGTMHLNMPACAPFGADIPVTGTLGGDAPEFLIKLNMVLPTGQALTLSLMHPGGHVSEMAGVYLITGAGCVGPSEGGASVASFGLTGAWRGTLTSSGGGAASMTLNLTQTGPDAHGLFSGTGTATITGGTCFSAATVDPSTFLIGAGSTLVLDGPAGGQTILKGDFTPPVFGETIFNGTYTSTQGACSDSGTVQMQFP